MHLNQVEIALRQVEILLRNILKVTLITPNILNFSPGLYLFFTALIQSCSCVCACVGFRCELISHLKQYGLSVNSVSKQSDQILLFATRGLPCHSLGHPSPHLPFSEVKTQAQTLPPPSENHPFQYKIPSPV